MKHVAIALSIVLLACPAAAGDEGAPTPLEHSVAQLRHVVGDWAVTTEFLNEDGSVARQVDGTYSFEWVVPDRVVHGRSDIPALDQSSAILFYIRESDATIEMTTVGADGRLWVMSGPLGGETRMTPEFATAGGGHSRLRFTRFNVGTDSFESRMEYTEDGGETWQPGNHQTFRRSGAAAGAGDD